MNKLISAFLFLSLTVSADGQTTLPALSPHARIQQQIGFTEIKIDYHRPSARGRKIFGELVPYGKVWKTGGGICTKLSFSDTVFVAGQRINPGTYSLYSIPEERQWTIILNRDTIGSYQEKNDVLRFQARTYITTRVFNALAIGIDFIPEEAELHIMWENTGVAFRIQTNTERKLAQLVTEQLHSENSNPDFFALAAEYYLFRNDELDQALRLVNRALHLRAHSWYYSLKVDILQKAGMYAEAIAVLKSAIAHDEANPENWSKEQFDEVMTGHANTMKALERKWVK